MHRSVNVYIAMLLVTLAGSAAALTIVHTALNAENLTFVEEPRAR